MALDDNLNPYKSPEFCGTVESEDDGFSLREFLVSAVPFSHTTRCLHYIADNWEEFRWYQKVGWPFAGVVMDYVVLAEWLLFTGAIVYHNEISTVIEPYREMITGNGLF